MPSLRGSRRGAPPSHVWCLLKAPNPRKWQAESLPHKEGGSPCSEGFPACDSLRRVVCVLPTQMWRNPRKWQAKSLPHKREGSVREHQIEGLRRWCSRLLGARQARNRQRWRKAREGAAKKRRRSFTRQGHYGNTCVDRRTGHRWWGRPSDDRGNQARRWRKQ